MFFNSTSRTYMTTSDLESISWRTIQHFYCEQCDARMNQPSWTTIHLQKLQEWENNNYFLAGFNMSTFHAISMYPTIEDMRSAESAVLSMFAMKYDKFPRSHTRFLRICKYVRGKMAFIALNFLSRYLVSLEVVIGLHFICFCLCFVSFWNSVSFFAPWDDRYD